MFNTRSSFANLARNTSDRNRMLAATKTKEEEEAEERRLAGEWRNTFSSTETTAAQRQELYGQGMLPNQVEQQIDEFYGSSKNPYEEHKNWFDRALAPFNAPQQFLFSLTKEVYDDGFQMRDLWAAASHGARYFNPWSDEQRITEDEILDVFGGDKMGGTGRLFANLAIGVLYDPLIVGGVAKSIASRAGAGAAALRNIDRVTNPASALLEGVAAGGRALKPHALGAAEAILGAERMENISTRLATTFLAPSRYLGDKWSERFGRVNTEMERIMIEATPIFKRAEDLGEEAHRLLAEAMETPGLRKTLGTVQSGGTGPVSDLRSANEFLDRVRRAGIDDKLFTEVLMDMSGIQFELAGMAVKHGILDADVASYQSLEHLRRAYLRGDHPVNYRRRINDLAQKAAENPDDYRHLTESRKVLHEEKLVETLSGLSDELLVPSRSTLARNFQVEGAAATTYDNKYFFMDGGVRKFDAKQFVRDLRPYLRNEQEHSITDALEYIRKTMMGGEELPASVAETIANYMSKGMVDTQTIDGVADALARSRFTTRAGFRNFGENLAVTEDRLSYAPELLEVLGETKSGPARLYDEIRTVGRQAVLGEMFDDVSGAKRISSELFERSNHLLGSGISSATRRLTKGGDVSITQTELTKLLKNAPEAQAARKEVRDLLRKNNDWMTDQQAHAIAAGLESGEIKANDVLTKLGGLATTEKTAVNTVQIMSESFGSLNGMWVPPTVAAHLQQGQRMMSLDNVRGVEDVNNFLMDWMSSITGSFKFLKIAADAGAHFRDTIGSLVQMDMYGVRPFNPNTMKKAINTVRRARNGEVDDYLAAAHDIGYSLFGTTLVGAELQRGALKASGELYKKGLDWTDDGKNLFQQVMDTVSSPANRMAEIYQTRESVLRSYTFIHEMDKLTSGMEAAGKVITRDDMLSMARQAAQITTKSLFDYADVSLATAWARKYGIAPFVTFPTKATGQMVDILYRDPWQLLKYDRGMDAWNTSWAGGDEAYAKEIAALPPHMRENLVVRLPWENRDGAPMYLDLSYFLPWSSVRDLTRDISEGVSNFLGQKDYGEATAEEVGRGGYPGAAAGGGIFTPVVWQIAEAVRTGKDGLGRPIFTETSTTGEKLKGISKFLAEFMLPPTWPGGATADSVGRAITAAARTSKEPVDWVEHLGLGMRGYAGGFDFFQDDDILNRRGEGPQSRALPTVSENPWMQAAGGWASLFLPVSTSDPERSARNASGEFLSYVEDIKGEMTQIARNPNLSPRNKELQMQRLRNLLQTESRRVGYYRQFLFD